jgi:transcriptional regulator with XRE-family HTH domain
MYDILIVKGGICLYNRIKVVRKHVKKTQKEFGESLGMSRDVYANIEYGRVEPSKTFIQLLCSTYNISEEWLLTGIGEMFADSDSIIVSQLAKQYNLDEFGIKFIESYMSLPKSHRDIIKNFAKSLLEAEDNTAVPKVTIDGNTIDDPEIASELSAIAWEYEQEKKATGKSSDSTSVKDA